MAVKRPKGAPATIFWVTAEYPGKKPRSAPNGGKFTQVRAANQRARRIEDHGGTATIHYAPIRHWIPMEDEK